MRPSSHRGSVPADGVVSLLRELEDSRVSGQLVYTAPDGTQGEVWLRLGQLDHGQPESHEGVDPVERFLALRGGSFEVIESLPTLEGSDGDAMHRRGLLTRHAVPDLMNYAETAGLSGVVRVEREGRVAEIVYAEGALVAIYLDGSADDVDEVFGWSEGLFTVTMKGAPSLLPPAPEPGSGADMPSPRIVERPLGELLDEAEQRRPRPLSVAPPRSLPPPRRESTVRIVLLGGSGEALFQSRSMIPPARSLTPPASPPRSPRLPAEPPSSARDADRTSTADDRRTPRRHGSVPTIVRPAVLPRWSIALIAVLLVAGIGAFVASLLTIG